MALIDNLESYYQFEDLNDSHSTNHLTDVGGVSFVAGLVNNAADFEFTGGTRYLTAVGGVPHNIGAFDWSWAGHFNPESSTGSQQVLVSRFNSTASQRAFFLRWDGSNFELNMFAGSSSVGSVLTSGIGLGIGSWHFIGAGHNESGNQMWIQVDNGTVFTSTPTGNPSDHPVVTQFGTLNLGAQRFDGMLDQWGYWKRDIRSDMATLYNGGAGLTYADIVAGGPSGGGQPAGRRLGGVPHAGSMKSRKGHMGGVWGRTSSGVIVPRRLAA